MLFKRALTCVNFFMMGFDILIFNSIKFLKTLNLKFLKKFISFNLHF